MRIILVSILVLIVLSACDYRNADIIEYKKYAHTPKFIRDYIDSVHYGELIIAEKGEEWNSGCVVSGKEPNCEFVSAKRSNEVFRMKVLSGGLALHYIYLKIKLQGDRATGYSHETQDIDN